MKTKIERITLAHVSDVHLSPVCGFWPVHWNAKRLLGFANWHFSRVRVHQRRVVEALMRDVMEHAPDHIVVTGDLANLGLPAEHEAAAHWLASLGAAQDVTVIPGNHDIYVDMKRDIGVARWVANMSSNDAGASLMSVAKSAEAFSDISGKGSFHKTKKVKRAPSGLAFPFCRVIGPLALIAVNSAVPTQPFYATGLIGASQRALLARALERARELDLVRVVLIHHPPLPGQAPPRRALRDAAELQQILKEKGAELVLHGHNHRDSLEWVKGPLDSIPVIGVASASAARAHHKEPMARYNIIRVVRWNSNVRFDITRRGTKKRGEPMRDIALQSFELRMS